MSGKDRLETNLLILLFFPIVVDINKRKLETLSLMFCYLINMLLSHIGECFLNFSYEYLSLSSSQTYFTYKMNIHLHDLVLSNMVSCCLRELFMFSFALALTSKLTALIMSQILLINHTDLMLMLIFLRINHIIRSLFLSLLNSLPN